MIGNLTEEKESLWDNVQRNMWMCFIVVSGQLTVAGNFGRGNEASVYIRGEEVRNVLSYSQILKMDFAVKVME